MFEKKLSWALAVAALAGVSQSIAQPASPQDEAALQREYEETAAERAALEREFAREEEEAQRERAAMERELAKAREELSRAVGDVARVSAKISEPILRDVERNFRFIVGGRSVLGLNIEDTELGVLVRGVTPNGPAAAAGVTAGETVVSINDVELARAANAGSARSPSAALVGEVGNVVPGDEVRLRLLRDGDYRDVVVQVGESAMRLPFVFSSERGSWPGEWAPFRQPGPWSDIELVALTPALGEYFGVAEGLLVVRAGRASELGFRDGDVIIDLAGREPQSPEHALRILASFEPGESLQAAIMRQRRREALAIRVPTTAAPF